ncbi:MAG: MFS transporter [Kofleriaceae bacterium]
MSRGALLATLAGNTLEFYDFITYTFFAVYVGRAFFPTDSEFASLLLSVATFGVGFLTRPLGGIWIGAYADRVGRKPALLLTIVLMTVGTLGLCVTPSYASIGVAAPILLVISRLVQGVALGGEVGTASSILVESAPPGKRALYMSLQSLSQGVATLGAGVVGLSLALVLTPEQLATWGWRAAFAVGLILVPVGFYLRRALPETLPTPTHTSGLGVLRAVIRDHGRELVLVVLVTMCMTVSTYVLTFMTSYAMTTLQMDASSALVAPIVIGVFMVVGAMIGGPLCERFGRKRTLIVSRLITIVIVIPAFLYVLHARSVFSLATMIAVLCLVTLPGAVAALTTMAEVFPSEIRAAGISVAYALTVTIFGATTQVIITWLLEVTGSPLAPAFYIIVTSVISIVAMAMMRETGDGGAQP